MILDAWDAPNSRLDLECMGYTGGGSRVPDLLRGPVPTSRYVGGTTMVRRGTPWYDVPLIPPQPSVPRDIQLGPGTGLS